MAVATIARDTVNRENEPLLTQTLLGGIIMSQQIHSYSELQQQIHQDLRLQHPDWVEPNGNCPTCDSYESRLAELLGLSQRSTAVRMQPSPVLGYAGDY
jgi:hypothetical protein